MTQQTAQRNPFMLMISPEVILAAIEKSERLGQLNRHLCRPLDRLSPAEAGTSPAPDDVDSDADGQAPA